MQKQKRLPGTALSRFAVCLGLLTGMVFNKSAFAQSYTICTGGATCYSCYLYANSLHDPAGMYVYDDGHTNWGGTGNNNGGWNCTRQYLLTEYTGTGTNIALQFSYTGIGGEPYTTPPTTSHDVYIYNNTTGTLLTTTPINIPDVDTSGFATTYTLPSTYTSAPAELLISYYQHGAVPGTDSPDIRGKVVLIRPIQKMWITASPICSDFSGAQYNFQIHSIPSFDSIMLQTPLYGVTPCDIYQYYPEMGIGFDYTNSTITVNHHNWQSWGATDYAAGFFWYPPISDTTDFNDVWINYSDLSYYLSGGGAGTTPVITAIYSDNITSDTLTVPIIIEAPAASPGPYDSTTTPYYFPPQATGTPSTSYDLYKYTLSGYESWTPSNNPIANMHGGGDVVIDTIRIQDSLVIPGGSGLTLDGMTVEFGPGAAVAAYPANDSTGVGGKLSLIHSTLTAYRGCGGTDESTWAGAVMYGNPAWPFGPHDPTAATPQSYLYMANSKIAYANIGASNGTYSGNTGGAFYVGGDLAYPDTFYNCVLPVSAWPYNPPVHGDLGTLLSFEHCEFINDSNCWVTPSSMVNATSVSGLHFGACTFTNATGHVIPYAVYGTDAGFAIQQCTFSKFTNGVYCSYIMGTQGLYVNECTFNNTNVGVACHGGIAPAITGNIFNIPEYFGFGGTSISGTDVLLVNDQNIGVYMNGATGYNISGNNFHTALGAGYYYRYTTGTLEYNTGSDPNQVTGNTFTAVQDAMLSNFVNNISDSVTTLNHGLQYTCNVDSSVALDIVALGTNGGVGGICWEQGTDPAGSVLADQLPAGNVFAGSVSNLYNTQMNFHYLYNSSAPAQVPARVYGCDATPVASAGQCYEAPSVRPFNNIGSLGISAYTIYAVTSSNVNYYMTSRHGLEHRDSLYYWAGQLNTPYGDLLTANLLIEDGLTDSAQSVYDHIFSKYAMDSGSTEGNDFVQGRNLIDLLVYKQESGEPLMSLTPSEVTTLQAIKATTTMWAHARAEGWLYAYDGEALTDSLLYPDIEDTSGGDGGRHANPNGAQPGAGQPKAAPPNQVYPNPVHDELEVIYTALSTQDITIEIEDISGRVIITQSLQSGVPASIDVSRLVPGMYLYRILEGANLTMVGKVAKD